MYRFFRSCVFAALLLFLLAGCKASAEPENPHSSSADRSELSSSGSTLSANTPNPSNPSSSSAQPPAVQQPSESTPPAVQQPSEPTPPDSNQAAVQPPQTTAPVSPPPTSSANQPDSSSPSSPPKKVSSTYDYTQPVPESEAVETTYFEDAAFIGDSRTDGFFLYSGVGCGTELTATGMSIFRLAEKKALTIDGKEYTLLEALALGSYRKVYISFGVNELGYSNDKDFYRAWCNAIDSIRESQPNAVIYIQNLIPINAGKINKDYMTNDRVRTYNDLMKQVAEEKQVFYLDLYSSFADENGELSAEASSDGIHLKSSYCKKWLEYLLSHTVDPTIFDAPADQPVEVLPDPSAETPATQAVDLTLPASPEPVPEVTQP